MYEDRMRLFEAISGGFDLYMALEAWILRRHPQTEIRVKKTQVGFFDGCAFAYLSPPFRGKAGVMLTLGLSEKLDSPRVFAATQPYPGRWTHHIPLLHAGEIDGELDAWLDAAHDFALSKRRR